MLIEPLLEGSKSRGDAWTVKTWVPVRNMKRIDTDDNAP